MRPAILATLAALALCACACGPALADDSIPLGGGISLTLHGKAHYTVLLPTGDRLETKADPIMFVNGVDVGHWPSSTVTYLLPNGVELTCHARGYNADTSEIEIWEPDSAVVRLIEGVNLPQQKHSERVLTRFEMQNLEHRDRGTILIWSGDAWKQVGAAPPADVGFLVEPPSAGPAVVSGR